MEKYPYNSYPDSADSSPRSREMEFENPAPWEDQQQQQNWKAKFMCSYGGKIQPRPHDNQLSYVGGETKILSVDRSIRFSVMIAKLAALCGGDTDISFKYQLPGEDLDALISVTNDDDLEHMMHEYDRLFRTPVKSTRMRLFIFPVSSSSGRFGSDGSGKLDRERFVEALNSGPIRAETEKNITAAQNNADFLFGAEKMVVPPPPHLKLHDSAPEHVPVAAPVIGADDRVIGSEHGVYPVEMQRQIQEFQRMQIRDQEQHRQQQEALYRRKSEDSMYEAGYYAPPMPEKQPPASVPQSAPAPAGFWQGKNMPGGIYPSTTPGLPDQPVYVISGHPPGAIYHAPPQGMVRPVTGQAGQGYYANVQKVPLDAYREQPAYNVVQQQHAPPPPSQAPPPQQFSAGPPPQQFSAAPPPQQFSAAPPPPVRSVAGVGGTGVTDAGYAQFAYEGGMGRQVYYNAPGGGIVVPPPAYQGVGVAVTSGDLRTGQEGKVVHKAPQGSF